MDFLPLPPLHTVEVVVAAGYRLCGDPNDPNQINNPSNSVYGNPRIVTNVTCFMVWPYVQVETGSVIRDRWTKERLSDVRIIFHPTSGRSTNDCDGDPWYATYQSDWYSQSDGTFPTNVWLPAVNYDLSLMNVNYSNGLFTNVIVNPTPGQTTDLGTLWLTPLDFNANGIADSWEERYFGANRPPMTNDADEDGHNNYEEYLVGTDPTNRDSVLKLHIRITGHP